MNRGTFTRSEPACADGLPSAEGRVSDRVNSSDTAILLRDHADDIPVALADISSEGIMFQSREKLWNGSLIWLQVPGLGLISATVVWSGSGRVGCRLTHRLNWRTLQKYRLADTSRSSEARPRRLFRR